MKTTKPVLNRADHVRATILSARKAEMSLAELQRALAPRLASWIRAVCLWDGSFEIGDYRFAVFSIDVAPKVQVYVQFWSEPGEQVLWEVSSGAWNPPADRWLSGERSQRVEAFGFQIGGKGENYGREVDVRSPADATRIARTVVDIFYAAFDYRGLQPVKAEMAYESRAVPRMTCDSFTPEDLVKILVRCGFHAELVDDDEDAPVLHAVRRGIVTKVALFDRIEDQHLFARAMLTSEIDVPVDYSAAALDGIVFVEDDTPEGTRLWTTLLIDGGVTVDWVARRLRDWDRITWSCRKEARRRKRVAAPTAGGRVH